MTRQQWEGMLADLALPADSFSACMPTHHCAAWQEYLGGDLGPNERLALEVVSQGVRPDFVHPQSASQLAHPRHQQLIADMHRQLAQRHGVQQAELMLDQLQPPSVQFPNSSSCRQHAEFFQQSTQQLRQWGAMKTPQEVGLTEQDIIIVAGFSVDVDRKQKKRLCYDGRCAG